MTTGDNDVEKKTEHPTGQHTAIAEQKTTGTTEMTTGDNDIYRPPLMVFLHNFFHVMSISFFYFVLPYQSFFFFPTCPKSN